MRTPLDRAKRVRKRCLRWGEQLRLTCCRKPLTRWHCWRAEDIDAVVDAGERPSCWATAEVQRGRVWPQMRQNRRRGWCRRRILVRIPLICDTQWRMGYAVRT